MTKQILLVEDELILCDNYAETIRENGYEVITCHTKQQALEIINTVSYTHLTLPTILRV